MGAVEWPFNFVGSRGQNAACGGEGEAGGTDWVKCTSSQGDMREGIFQTFHPMVAVVSGSIILFLGKSFVPVEAVYAMMIACFMEGFE